VWLSITATTPWLIYWHGLRQIEGRPTLATHAATAEQVDRLLAQLRMTQPIQINPISPYTVLLQADQRNSIARLAWIVARCHNMKHLADRRNLTWHLSGTALAIWLTRNWTTPEIIAKAVTFPPPVKQPRARNC